MPDCLPTVALDDIVFDSETQSRVLIDAEKVDDYRAALDDGAEFPPLSLFYDGERYWIGDGYHRAMCYRAAGRKEVPAEVRPGGKRDAILHAVGANATHGMQRTNADKRRAVTMLLNDPEWSQWSNVAIAQTCRVSESLVRSLRPEPPSFETKVATRQGRDGKTYDTTNIGKSKAKPKPTPEPQPEAEPTARVNGVASIDPPDVAALRAAGKIHPDAIVTVTEPEPIEEAEPEPITEDSEEAFLASLPARATLSGRCLRIFDQDAAVYREVEAHRKTLAHHATRIMNAKNRRGGEYAYILGRFLRTAHPKHWKVCPAPEHGGCNGTGRIELIGECQRCHGHGSR